MAKKTKVEIEINAKGGSTLKKTTQETKKQAAALDKRTRASKAAHKADAARYTHEKQAIIGTAPAAKNFSKMSRSMDGGTGAGGLVRAYALLAANVFALSAAFGVLSRAAQVDTLMESMQVLEKTTGQAVRVVGQELQKVSGYGMDLAESMRSTSLAMSAGFDSTAIKELGEVARNAAVSLGRPMGDALDRIFRGVIKVEPELLDEIGLFVRVKDASAKYASSLGIAASELTEFQKRQAFAAEAIRQGQEKFEDFAEVDTDQFSRLAAAFSDIAQKALSMINTAIKPMINLFATSGPAMVGLFTVLVGLLLRKAVPALGLFATSAKRAATDAVAANAQYREDIEGMANNQRRKAVEMIDAEKAITKNLLAETRKRRKAIKGDYAGQKTKGGAALKAANAQLKIATTAEKRLTALKAKRKALEKSKHGENKVHVQAAITGLKEEIRLTEKLIGYKQKYTAAESAHPELKMDPTGSAARTKARLKGEELTATGLQQIAGKGEFGGMGAAFKSLKTQWKALPGLAKESGASISKMQKAVFGLKGAGTVAAVGIQKMGMALNAMMGYLALILPALMWFLKRMGMWNKAHKEFQEVQKKSNAILDTMSDKLDHQAEVMDRAESNTRKFSDAAGAMATTMSVSARAVLDSVNAWDKFQKEGSAFAVWWEKFKIAMSGGDTPAAQAEKEYYSNILKNYEDQEEAIKKLLGNEKQIADAIAGKNKLSRANFKIQAANQDALIKKQEQLLTIGILLKAADSGATSFMFADNTIVPKEVSAKGKEAIIAYLKDIKKTLLTEMDAMDFDKFIERMSKEFSIKLGKKGIEDQSKKFDEFAESARNLQSIMENATDVSRTYLDTFITKTDLDKPLAVFAQLTSMQVSDTEGLKFRASMLDQIANRQHVVNSLMGEEQRIAYKQTLLIKDEEKRGDAQIKILQTVEEHYQRMQSLIVLQKTETAAIVALNKKLSTIIKKDGELMNMRVKGEERILELKQQLKKDETDRHIATVHLKRDSENLLKLIRAQVTSEEELKILADSIGIGTQEAAEIRKDFMEEGIINADLLLKRSTMQHEVDLAINKALKDRLVAQEKLLKIELKRERLLAERTAFGRSGSQALNVQEETKLLVSAEKARLEMAEKKARIEFAVIDAQHGIIIATLAAQQKDIDAYNKTVGVRKQIVVSDIVANLEAGRDALKEVITEESTLAGEEFANAYIKSLTKGLKTKFVTEVKSFTDADGPFSDMMAQGNVLGGIIDKGGEIEELNRKKDELNDLFQGTGALAFPDAFNALNKQIDELKADEFGLKMDLMTHHFLKFAEAMKEFGTEGILAATIAEFTAGSAVMFKTFAYAIKNDTLTTTQALAGLAYSVQSLAAIVAAAGKNKISGIDKEIAAEKKRDGQSKASLARIKGMEAEKEKVARSNFEKNKKLAMANVVISTAMAITQLWANPADWFKVWASAMTPVILGLGAAQLAIISGTSYAGGGSVGGAAAKPASIEVGKRSDKVDVSKGATAGELAYLAGDRGIGTNANNFKPIGGAAGLRKGYAQGGYLVGERGPEMMYPTGGFNVVPNDDFGGAPINANFTIQALDASGVEEVLLGQQGNIINMIRSAANEYGEEFIESVNTDFLDSGTTKTAEGSY